MSTTDHVIAECGRLRVAWTWLTEATIPGRARRNQRAVTERAAANRDRQAAAERADRPRLLSTGKLLTGSSGAPANVSAIDARGRIADNIDTAAWTMASAMRNQKYTTNYRPDGRTADHRFRTGIDWISMNAPRLQDHDTINTTYRALVDANTLATAVSGAGPEHRPMSAACPACQRRTLVWDTSSERYEEWHVVCQNPRCRCDGRDCACRLPDRQPGTTHVWLESMWERLAEQLTDKETTR